MWSRPELSCDQFQQCPCLPIHYTPPATACALIWLSLPTRAGERSLCKPTGTAAAPTAQVQRLNYRKHVQYINISADSNLGSGKQGLHKGLRTEDVTSDRAGGSGQAFSRSAGANGSRGSSSSSFVLGGVSYQTDGLISTKGLYHTSHLWALTRGQRATSNYQRLAILQEQQWMKEKRRTNWFRSTSRAHTAAVMTLAPLRHPYLRSLRFSWYIFCHKSVISCLYHQRSRPDSTWLKPSR